jgi:hypothetical protein
MNILLAKLTGKTNEILKIMSTENEEYYFVLSKYNLF